MYEYIVQKEFYRNCSIENLLQTLKLNAFFLIQRQEIPSVSKFSSSFRAQDGNSCEAPAELFQRHKMNLAKCSPAAWRQLLERGNALRMLSNETFINQLLSNESEMKTAFCQSLIMAIRHQPRSIDAQNPLSDWQPTHSPIHFFFEYKFKAENDLHSKTMNLLIEKINRLFVLYLKRKDLTAVATTLLQF